MRIVAQRVSSASVSVDGETVAAIGRGLCLLVGVAGDDGVAEVEAAAEKLAGLRVFADQDGKLNRSLLDIRGEALVISQFTLIADIRRGRRPSFSDAAPPDVAAPLIAGLVRALRSRGVTVAEGEFGASMRLQLVNDGPVTLTLDVAGGKIR